LFSKKKKNGGKEKMETIKESKRMIPREANGPPWEKWEGSKKPPIQKQKKKWEGCAAATHNVK